MSKLSENLRRLRITKGVYLKEIAPVLGVSVGTMSNYEKDIHEPPLCNLVTLADYYGVSVDYLIGHTDCTCPISAINRVIYGNCTVGRFRELLDRLTEEDLRHLSYILRLFELRASVQNKKDKKRS